MDIVNQIEHILAQPLTPMVLTIVYLGSVFLLQLIFPPIKDKEKSREIAGFYDSVTILHNLILAIESAMMTYGIAASIMSIYQEVGFEGIHCDAMGRFQTAKAFQDFLVSDNINQSNH